MAAFPDSQGGDLGSGAMMPADLERIRHKWRCYWRAKQARHAAWERLREARWQEWRRNPSGMRWREPPRPAHVPMPADLHLLTCGARTRAGTPCKRRDLYLSGRCKLHGGLSTGPTTDDGKARSARNALAKALNDAERTPCEGQGYGKVETQNEPHVSLRKADFATAGAGLVSAQCWRNADGL